MSEILTVPVVTAMPSRRFPQGALAEGHYRVEDGMVTLVTRGGTPRTDNSGKLIRHKLGPGETARAVAHRLAKRNLPKGRSDFNRPIHYPKSGVA